MNKNPLAELIGRNICKYREKSGMTQAQLAEKIGVGASYISRLERGEKSMKIYTLYSLAEALNVTCDALLYPELPSCHINNIIRLLEDCPTAYLVGIEALVRTCKDHFLGLDDAHKNMQKDNK